MQTSNVQSFAVTCLLSHALSLLCLLSELCLHEFFLVHGCQVFGFKGLNVLLDAVGTSGK